MTQRSNFFRASFVKSGLLGLSALAMLATSACTIWREEGAIRLATPVHMIKRQIETDTMNVVAFERVRNKGSIATVYIEGDGLVMAGTKNVAPTFDPTPDHPTALHLATRDNGDNVIYLARPCQYLTPDDNTAKCGPDAAGKRFSIENMEIMNAALDNIQKQYGFVGFHLVGYDGGGQVAVLLAAKRATKQNDVLTIRTVASALDHLSWTAHHNLPPLDGNLNATDFAMDVANIPQHHFVGAWDDVVGADNYQSFRHSMGPSSCVRMSVIDETDHRDGWVNRWPSILEMPVNCAANQ